jgi:threonine synthase
MVRAFHAGEQFAEPWRGASTIADGLRVPAAVGDFMILRALYESAGTAVAVPDHAMIEAANTIGCTEGVFVSPEGGATLVAFRHLEHAGWIGDDETVVLFNTGSGLKYAHLWA